MRTRATAVPGGYRLNGRKRWITNSCAADIMTVLCVVEDSQAMLLVDMHADGVWVAEPDLKMGNRVQLTSDVEFTDVFVPDEHVIAIPGRGLSTALASLAMGRIGVAAMGVGMGQCAFDHAVRHMRQRSAFGSKLGGFQHWQFRFAEHAIALESARSLYQKAARKVDVTGRPEPEAAMAKVVGSRVAVDIARDAIQVHGGYGFVRQLTADGTTNHLESIWRDSKVGEIYEGANEVQLWSIARVAWAATSPADVAPGLPFSPSPNKMPVPHPSHHGVHHLPRSPVANALRMIAVRRLVSQCSTWPKS